MSKNLLSSIIVFVVGALLLTGLNFVTAPIIEKNNANAASGALLEVMPEGTGFELIYASDTDGSTLKDVSPYVYEIYKENAGLGYVLTLVTTEGYTKEPINITVGINNEGKITGIKETDTESKLDWKPSFMEQFAGQDSTMADVALYAGCTYSTSAIKNAVAGAFESLIANDLMKAGVKSASQIFMESLPTLCSGMVNAGGVAQYTEISSDAEISMMANNNSTAAFITGDKLVVINNCGVGAVYTVDGEEVKDVTADNADLITKYAAAVSFTSTTTKDVKKLDKMNDSGSTVIDLKSFNSVVTAVKFGNGQYGFVARPYGYGNDCMVVYYVLNANGEIVSMKADEFILIAEYFNAYTLDEAAYKDSFVGLTIDSFGDQYLISGATVSSDAMKVATNDVFEAFNAIVGGNN